MVIQKYNVKREYR